MENRDINTYRECFKRTCLFQDHSDVNLRGRKGEKIKGGNWEHIRLATLASVSVLEAPQPHNCFK